MNISFQKIKEVLKEDSKLIELKEFKRIVFVGETHGDLQSSQKVIKNYLKPGNKIVFLGDYTDRGPASRENLDFLLKIKEENKESIYLLQGNHEGHHILKFFPADFWRGLDKKEYKKYASITERLPLVFTTKDVIALHGALPDVKNLNEINDIKLGSKEWLQICWGDFVEKKGQKLENKNVMGRPKFGKDYFFRLMETFNKKVLIRSHQAHSPQFMFKKKCLTLLTSSVYGKEKIIAILNKEKKIKTAKDLEIVKI